MQHASGYERGRRARFRIRLLLLIGVVLVAMLGTGCASYSSVSGTPASRGDTMGRCPLGQAKVCHVGWPSRLGDGDRDRSCRCS